MTQTPEPTEAMIAAGLDALLAVINGTQNPQESVADIWRAMEAAREPEAGKLREALEDTRARWLTMPNCARRNEAIEQIDTALSRNQGDGR